MKSYNSGSAVFVLLIIIALSIVGYSLITQQSKSNITPPPSSSTPTTQLPVTIPSSANPIFQKVKDLVESKTQPDNARLDDKSYVWWISDDGYNIINEDSFGIQFRFDCKNYSASRFSSSLMTLAPIFPTFMQLEGFNKNILNSSVSLNDDKFYDYVQAYEKNGLKCTLTADPDCSGGSDGNMWQTITFSCTSEYNKNYASQSPILKDLNIKNAVIYISKQIENFAKIQVHYRRTGHYVIAVKENGTWKELYKGQDTPECSIMNQYNVPKEIYDGCY